MTVRRGRLALLVAAGVAACGGPTARPAPAAPAAPERAPAAARAGALTIRIFDVGQNDAQLIVASPPGRSLLIDLGEEGGRGARAAQVARAIERAVGRRHLDYVLVTHYHADHVGARGSGLFALLDREGVTVDTLVDRGDFVAAGDPPPALAELRRALETWVPRGVVRRRVQAHAGSTLFDLGPEVQVEIVTVDGDGLLAARHRGDPSRYERCPPSENDYSVALKISLGPFEYFTGGDLSGSDSERRFGLSCTSYNDIESRIADRVGNIEVLRASHHGSAHSSSARFVGALAPEVAVISTGGRYGHPAQPVIERLLARAALFVTGPFSAQAWPAGPPPSRAPTGPGFLHVGGDVEIVVAPGGGSYAANGQRHRSFTDAEETAGRDRPAVGR